MKLAKILILFTLIITLVNLRKVVRRNSKAKSSTKAEPFNSPFNKIAAIISGGGNTIRVYNKDGHRVGKFAKKSFLILTGEIRIIKTTHGTKKMHRVREATREIMTDLKTANTKKGEIRVTGEAGEMWVGSSHLNIQYPNQTIVITDFINQLARGVQLYERGNNQVNFLNNAACWNFALTGDIDVDTTLGIRHLYENGIVIAYDFHDFTFTKLGDNWETYLNQNQIFGIVSPEARKQLKKAATNVIGLANNVLNDSTLKFTKAMLQVAAEFAGYTILPDGTNDDADRYQLHMQSTSFYGWDHWGVSVKMGNGERNYIQKIPGASANLNYPNGIDGRIHFNGNYIWDIGMRTTTFNLLSLKRALFDIFESN